MVMMRKLAVLFLVAVGFVVAAAAQCPTTNITGNFSPANGDTLSGVYNITGNFTLGPGITVHVRPFSQNSCGSLEIYAGGNIFVAGTILATGAGSPGGAAGAAGLANNINNIEQCSSPTDQCADIFTFGGGAGGNAFGSGAGLGGTVGQNGSGRKDRCLNFGDEGGRVGGAGGAGAGAGGSYGGLGIGGANGGNGSVPTMSTSDVGCSSTPIAAGSGTAGGAVGTAFGTQTGTDIAIGAGGGGAGGGGRGRFAGTAGGPGGSGGGMVKLVAAGTLTFSGTITANGTPGNTGGNGGNAGASSRCCVDACNGVDEYTHTGAGGGGGGGGGGSGGGILLQAGSTANITGTLNANGSSGAPGGTLGTGYTMNQNCIFGNSNANAGASQAGAFGGGGGGGRVKVFFNPCANGNVVNPNMNVSGGTGNGTAQVGTTHVGPLGGLTVGAAQPAVQTLCFNGDPATLTVQAPTGGLGVYTLQWQSQPNCTGPWANIPGATSLTYDPPAGIQDTTCYRLSITSGSCTVFSDTLRADVQPALGVPVNPAGPVNACLGDSVTLTTSGGPGATYQWYYNGSAINQATDSFLVATATGSYSCITHFPIGCDGQSQPVVMTFSPPPAAFALALADTVICPGSPVALLAVGNGSFQWLLNGSPIPGATQANYSATQPGNYSVAVTITGGCTAASSTVTVTSGAIPVAALSLQGASTFCASDSTLLTASGGGPYSWLLDGQPLPGLNGTQLYPQVSGNYQVIATSPDGCTDTSAIMPITVNPDPVAVLSTAGLPVTCTGDSVVFYASGIGSYQWLYNGTLLPDTTPYYHAGITGDYTLIVTNAAGCTDTSLTYAFSYYPPVFPSLSVTGTAHICPGDTLAVQASGAGAVSWTWLRNDTLVPGTSGPTLSITTPGAYAAVAHDQYGCDYPSALVLAYPGLEPTVGLSLLGDNPYCPGEILRLLASGGDQYMWFQDSLLLASTDSLIVVPGPGDYRVIAITNCGMDTSSNVLIQASAGPTAGFAYDNYPTSLVQFRDSSISGAVWHWDFGFGSNSSEQNPLHQFPNPGEYTVTMVTWDINGCPDTITRTVYVTDPDFFIPNVFSPNADGINDVARTNFRMLTDFQFSIYDRWGRRVFQTTTQDTWWDGKLPGGGDAPDGVYFYYLEGDLPQHRQADLRGPITLVR